MDFKGKTVIVTGAGGGIGEGYAKACAAQGMNVVIAELAEEGGRRVAGEIEAEGGRALFVKTDVGDEQSARDCVAAAVEVFGGVDYLINNAAIFGDMKIQGYLDVDMDYLEKFMRINAHGALIMTRAVVDAMTAAGGGAIINQSSTAAWMGVGYYGVAKLALNGITQSLARELGPRNIRINAIAPGPTDTGALQKTSGDYAQEMIKTMPLGRLGQPSDMADAALFLLSDQSSWITGQIINVDGGQIMRP
ncbi:SDR family oxidoreductase [Parahaliea maris]|uniref:SDR family oxidoreductase n=1 Tax=Parahaliea maris TaxID=2716870 RepID=A0A5C9A8W4_9GAMM|nr:SDR family oxidoreductase [Parahaliea maris]TXS96130.1 SDR family oxidoreductase [Parahaliea maris]